MPEINKAAFKVLEGKQFEHTIRYHDKTIVNFDRAKIKSCSDL